MSLETPLDRNKAFAAADAMAKTRSSVIRHADCGSTLLADPDVRRGFAARGGFVGAELA